MEAVWKQAGEEYSDIALNVIVRILPDSRHSGRGAIFSLPSHKRNCSTDFEIVPVGEPIFK